MADLILPHALPRLNHEVGGAGHFIQEDRGTELARIVVEFVNS